MAEVERDRRLQHIYHAAFLKGALHPVTLITGSDTAALVDWVFQFAQQILCEKNGTLDQDACGTCGSCIRIQKRSSESILHLRPEGLQLKLEETRRALQFVSLKTTSRARILIFERADLLNPQAANTLLKTLEEPPPKTLFFLVSPSPQDVMVTLRSRAQMIKLIPSALGSRATIISESQSSEWHDLRILAQNLLNDVLHRSYNSFFTRWKSDITDREIALDVIRLWQELIRDVIFLKVKQTAVLHPQESALLLNAFKEHSVANLQSLFQLCYKIETDVKSNVDRTLAVESLWQFDF